MRRERDRESKEKWIMRERELRKMNNERERERESKEKWIMRRERESQERWIMRRVRERESWGKWSHTLHDSIKTNHLISWYWLVSIFHLSSSFREMRKGRVR